MAKVLVVGGAGYVGSSTCAWLIDSGHSVWVLDDFSTGCRELVLSPNFVFGRAGDVSLLSELVQRVKFDCVMHFAARSQVGESLLKPQEYHENNVVQTEALLKTLIAGGVRNFIFSSSCAIFGDPKDSAIHENLEKKPLNPYGQNKLDVEKQLENLASTSGFRSIALRYFNAAGADPKLRVGEWHEPETHLIPRVLRAASLGEPLEVFGTDYSTPDGTCIRDYVHVWDLAAAHGSAMERLLKHGNTETGIFESYNLGSEKGFSVLEVVRACEEVTGKKIQILEKGRRQGDPPRLVAESALAKKVLGFDVGRKSLKDMLSSAWEWEKKRSKVLRRAIFLDRDGTLNEDPGYLHDPEQVKLLPKVGESLALLKASGFLLIVVSNQSGVGRGLIRKEDMPQIHQRLDDLLRPFLVKVDHYELCFHHPDEQCGCRKPKPKLILDAAHALNIDLSRSYMIGDKISDLNAGHAAGCKGSILVCTGEGSNQAAQLQRQQTTYIGENLFEVAKWILEQENLR